MPKRIRLELSEREQEALERWRRNPPRPYLRDRAIALLRVAAGEPLMKVGPSLRTPVHRVTVAAWVERYQAEGLAGLKVKPGRGRKAAFSPSLGGASARSSRDSAAEQPA